MDIEESLFWDLHHPTIENGLDMIPETGESSTIPGAVSLGIKQTHHVQQDFARHQCVYPEYLKSTIYDDCQAMYLDNGTWTERVSYIR